MRHLPMGLSQGCDVPSINYAICATLGDSNPTADSVKTNLHSSDLIINALSITAVLNNAL